MASHGRDLRSELALNGQDLTIRTPSPYLKTGIVGKGPVQPWLFVRTMRRNVSHLPLPSGVLGLTLHPQINATSENPALASETI